MSDDPYDPRIQMVAGYTRPRPPPRRQPRWLRRLLRVVLALACLVAVLALGEAWLARRPLVALERVEDYRPLAVTRLYAPGGEVVAEIVGAPRRVVSSAAVPPALARAVVERVEQGFLSRPALGQRELGRAILGRLRGLPESTPLPVALVRSLAPAGAGPLRFVEEWLTAMRLERRLSRAELLHVFLNQVPFGGGCFGIEACARARFGRSIGALDAAQTQALAALVGSDAPPPRAPRPPPRDACGELAAQKLRDRYEPDELARLGAEVTTPCEPTLARTIGAAIARARLDKGGLAAAAVVLRLPGQELVAAVGDVGAPRPIDALRAPFVFAAALQTRKWTLITPLETDGPPLHVAALRAPLDAVDALFGAGLSVPGTIDLVAKAGVATPLDPEAFARGAAPVTPLELAAALAALAEGGQHRMPQLLRAIDGAPESEGTRAALPVFTPEVAWLVLQLATAPRPQPAAPTRRGPGAWTALLSADAVVLVWVGRPDGGALPDGEAERASAAIAHEAQAAALHGKPPRAFARPHGLVPRRVDPTGKLLPQSSSGGVEEWFVPGSLPRDELPPE